MTDTQITSYKGFDKNLSCRGFQYQLGETYTHTGPVQACESGFHACEYPLDVFRYYAPATSRYVQVTQSGDLSRESIDSKIASRILTLNVELSLTDIVNLTVKYVFGRSHPEGESATGNYGAASATGYQGKAKGSVGNALFLLHRDAAYNITHVWAGIVGQNGILPDTWYRLDDRGEPVVVVA